MEEIFEGEPNEPWPGINTRSGHDRYVYIIEVLTEFGKKHELKGMVTLVN
jgi:hypothetical protein